MTLQASEQSLRNLRSRAKVRDGIVAIRRDAKARNRSTTELATVVIDQLASAQDHQARVSQIVAESQQPKRQVVEAIQLLTSEGRITTDVANATVKLAGR